MQALTIEQKQAIRNKIESYLAAKTISQSRFAELSKISTANISNILKGKWDKISDDIWRKVEDTAQQQVEQANELAQKFKWRIVKGKGFLTINNLCQDAQDNNRMLAVYGETGYGKTSALKEYKKENPKATYYVLCDELMNQKQFLQAMAEELGVEVEGDKNTILRAVVQALNSKANPLLILDDCGKLNDNCLRLIRLVYDRTVDRVGIVLAGTTYFKNYVEMRVRKDTMGFRELHRRIEYWQEISKPEDKVVQVICQQYGIIDDGCVNYILSYHAANFGKLKSTITNVQRLRKDEGISLELLKRIK
jgi:DNA transposition AAA+ family ATPase